jgi:hypothetical protein
MNIIKRVCELRYLLQVMYNKRVKKQKDHTKSSPFGFTIHCLVTALNNGYSAKCFLVPKLNTITMTIDLRLLPSLRRCNIYDTVGVL